MSPDAREGRTAPPSRRAPTRFTATLVALAALVTVAAVAGCGRDGDADGTDGADATDRQAEVAERGASVMPFDLDATSHLFAPRDDGLVQTVVADDPADDVQVGLVREHLAHEADSFRAGDFGDPASIHGHDMPGLAELEAGADRITVGYAETTAGASISYVTDDPALVEALHDWADAQVEDHGDHAEHVGDPDHGG